MPSLLEELASNGDLSRRISLRQARDRRGGIRKRARCKRCNLTIPEDRRRDALYCSVRCHRSYRRDKISALRNEMRLEVRKLTAPRNCPCGEPLDNIREGKRRTWIKKLCTRCRNRENSRKYRERKKSN